MHRLTTLRLVLALALGLAPWPDLIRARPDQAAAPAAGPATISRHAAANHLAARQPTSPGVCFVESVGQFAPAARFKVEGAGTTRWLTDGLVIERQSLGEIKRERAVEVVVMVEQRARQPRAGFARSYRVSMLARNMPSRG